MSELTKDEKSKRRITVLKSQIQVPKVLSHEKTYNTFQIGNTKFKINNNVKFPQFVPNLFVQNLKFSKETMEHLQWISQKDSMSQDMFLIGHPGPYRRRITFMYCEITKREIEYVVITRDTTEHDLKQRREIQNRNAFYVDQAAVRAAIHGRVLILDGIEKSERNILPILNNLLENREMSLEDGRLLIDINRYKKLQKKSSKVVPVHPDFRVIAIGLPIPPYEGNSLDPPLRSRFQSRKFDLEPVDIMLHELKNYNVPKDVINSLMAFSQLILHITDYSDDIIKEYLPPLPLDHLLDLVGLMEKLGKILNEKVLRNMIKCVYPVRCLLSNDNEDSLMKTMDKGVEKCSSECHSFISENFENPIKIKSINSENKKLKLIFSTGDSTMEIFVGGGELKSKSYFNYVQLDYHETLIFNMILSHWLKRDLLIVGSKGCGKSVILRQFAALLGYKVEYIPMYKDMTLRDLFKRRTTDNEGNTIWQKSALIDAIVHGRICILDGVDRLGSDILLSLQSLIHDRCLFLIDGSRYISQDRYEDLLKIRTKDDLDKDEIFAIHSNFRLIATGLPPSVDESTSSWFSKEVLMLFHCHFIESLPLENEIDLISNVAPNVSLKLIKTMLKLKNEYNNILESDEPQEIQFSGGNHFKYISTRDLLRVLKRINRFPDESIFECLERTTMTQFLPTEYKKGFQDLLNKYGFYPTKPENLKVKIEQDFVKIGDIKIKQGNPTNHVLVPNPFYVHTDDHTRILKALFKDHILGVNSLLIGNQGVGKNKITDYFLSVLKLEKEYMQLHRDITIHSLTVQPSVQDGVLVYIDSPLVRAVQYGRILMLDECDKAPLEVVSIIKSLIDDGEMVLSDHRRIMRENEHNDPNVITIHPDFRMIVLANRPGFPFQGNDFFRECGDLFSSHYVDNPKGENEIKMLKEYAPNVSVSILRRLTDCFNDLRKLVDENEITYPYSTRELVSIVKHLEKYPENGLISALQNVIGFDMFNEQIMEKLTSTFHRHGIPLEKVNSYDVSLSMKSNITVGITKDINLILIESQEIRDIKKVSISPCQTNPATSERSSVRSHRVQTLNELQYSIETKLNEVEFISTLNDDTVHVLTSGVLGNMVTYLPDSYSTARKIEIFHYFRMYYTSICSLKSENKILILGVINTMKESEIYSNMPNICIMVVDSTNTNAPIKQQFICPLPVDSVKNVIFLSNYSHCNLVTMLSENSNNLWILDFNDKSAVKIQNVEIPKKYPIETVYWIQESKFILFCKDAWFLVSLKSNSYQIFELIDFKDYLFISNCYQGNKFIGLRASDGCLDHLTITSNGIVIAPFKINKKDISITNPILTSNGLLIGDKFNSMRIIDLKKMILTDIEQKSKLSILGADQLSNEKLVTLHSDNIIRMWELDHEKLKFEAKEFQDIIQGEIKESNSKILVDDQPVDHDLPPAQMREGGQGTGGSGGEGSGGIGGEGSGGQGGESGSSQGGGGGGSGTGPNFQTSNAPNAVDGNQVSDIHYESMKKARLMAQDALKKQLNSIKMSPEDLDSYNDYYNPIKTQISQMRTLLENLRSKEKERIWIKNKAYGEIDDNKIVEGITGEKLIYQKRGEGEIYDSFMHKKKKLLHFCMDVSCSMYRFNGYDRRLDRMIEVAICIMESLSGFEERFSYSITGHSGSSQRVPFIGFNKPPKNKNERLKVALQMRGHSQSCASGDTTLETTDWAISQISKMDADERFVFIFSDANITGYGFNSKNFSKLLTKNSNVKAFVIFISSPNGEAEKLVKELPIGRGYCCLQAGDLGKTFQKIFTSNVLNEK
eukprot:gene4332-7688_t